MDLEGNLGMPLARLREHDTPGPNLRPTTGPEIDDPEPPDSGIDDGLLPRQPGGRRPSITPSFPPGGGDFPREFPNGPSPGTPRVPPTIGPRTVDLNVYQHKKTLAQGMMDLALLSANANQLRYVLENEKHPYYYAGLILISTSIFLQVIVGIGLILNSRYNIKHERDIWKADHVNNLTILGVFLVTITNVFISAFGVAITETTVHPILTSHNP